MKVVFVFWRDFFVAHRRKVMRVTHKGMTEQPQPSARESVDAPSNTQRIVSRRQTPVHRIIMSNSLIHVCRITTPNRYTQVQKKRSQPLPHSGTQKPEVTKRNTHKAETFHPDTNIHM